MNISMRSIINGFFAAAAVGSSLGPVVQSQNARPEYKLFRYDENWGSLAHSTNQHDWLDPLKYIRLGKEDRYLTLGGSMQEKYELLNRPGFGTGLYDPNGYLLQRYLLSADLHLGLRVRLFTELQSGLAAGRTGGPRPTDADLPDGHQGFVDWRILTGKSAQLTVRIGRQEVGFGSGRLIAPAEGLNLRRSMDGAPHYGGLWKDRVERLCAPPGAGEPRHVR